jgi:anaerobic magnesium-protoporphyrin IX monomethyl ester cyclase
MSKVMLATVNCKKKLYGDTDEEFSAIAPDIPMGLLVSYLTNNNVPVEMIDSNVENISIEDLVHLLIEDKPSLLCLIAAGANPSASTMSMVGIIDFFKKFHDKEETKKIPTAIWGPHPTVLPDRTFKETGADFIIKGEGYETLLGLYESITRSRSLSTIKGLCYMKNGRFIQNEMPALVDADTLPMIDWSRMHPSRYRAHNWHCFGDLDNRTPYAIIWTSFGCPFSCIYCCINNLFGKRIQRFRSIGNVIKEISILVEKYHVKHLKVLDELFVVHPKRIEEFCDRLEAKGYDLNMWAYSRVDTINRRLLKRLKKVGMNWISYGFETATPEILKSIKKGCGTDKVDEVIRMTQDEGIYICADVMVGMWEENYDTLNRTYDFLVKYNFEWVNIYPMFAYPGTELYKSIEEPKSWSTYALYGYECVPRGTKYLSPEEVLKFRDEAFIEYHKRPAYFSMIERKFGKQTREHVEKMTKIRLKRRILGD